MGQQAEHVDSNALPAPRQSCRHERERTEDELKDHAASVERTARTTHCRHCEVSASRDGANAHRQTNAADEVCEASDGR